MLGLAMIDFGFNFGLQYFLFLAYMYVVIAWLYCWLAIVGWVCDWFSIQLASYANFAICMAGFWSG